MCGHAPVYMMPPVRIRGCDTDGWHTLVTRLYRDDCPPVIDNIYLSVGPMVVLVQADYVVYWR